MAPSRSTRSSARNNPEYTHCSLTPESKPRKKKRKSIFNLTGQETHIAGVSRCQRIMKETVTDIRELQFDMETQRTKMGYTDPNRIPLKEFFDMVESLLKDRISGRFNKMVLSALYPHEGAEPPSISELETAWTDILPTVAEVKVEYTRLCKLRDNNWVAPTPSITKSKKTPKKAPARRKGRKKAENKEN